MNGKVLSIFFVVFVLGIFLINNVAGDKIYNRVISFSPSITEIIYALHAEDQLIGVNIYCVYPPEVQNKTKVGVTAKPDIEKVISLNPDLVFVPNYSLPSGNMDPNYIKIMQNANITVVIINYPYSIEDIYNNTRTIAKYLGKEKEAENLIKNMKERIENVKKLKDKYVFSTPKIAQIYYSSQEARIWVYGKNSLNNEEIEIAG
ncbi:MAG: helical backbone metal receptor, partial [Candidatus Altarchaeaceae archaeon]